jgi:hypothetical protein
MPRMDDLVELAMGNEEIFIVGFPSKGFVWKISLEVYAFFMFMLFLSSY